MPLVRVRILHGKTQLAAPSRPFAADATLHHVVGKALEPFADYCVNVLEVFPAADEAPMKKSEFFPEDFESITLIDIGALLRERHPFIAMTKSKHHFFLYAKRFCSRERR